MVKEVPTSAGLVQQEVRPEMEPPALERSELALHPGAVEAWEGLAKTQWHVCVIKGHKLQISEARVAEFASAPQAIIDKVNELKKNHVQQFQDALAGVVPMAAQDALAPLEAEEREEEAEDVPTGSSLGLTSYDSEKELGEITCQYKLKGNIHLLHVASCESWYLVARGAKDATLKRYTFLGSVGSGHTADAQDANEWAAQFPWDFPDGDKTLIELLPKGSEEGAKSVTIEPLYKLIRELEAKTGGLAIKLTTYGEVKTSTEGGLHRFTIEKEDRAIGKAWISTATGAANCLGNVWQNTLGKKLGGAVKLIWRTWFDDVACTLKPKKPVMVLAANLELKAGCPVKVAWLA